jgi:hypothetical protein
MPAAYNHHYGRKPKRFSAQNTAFLLIYGLYANIYSSLLGTPYLPP